MYLSAIIVAAGSGIRLGSKVSKALVKIGRLPMIVYSLQALNNHNLVRDIIVAANPKNRQDIDKLIKKYRISKVRDVVFGGLRRQDSVRNSLEAVNKNSDFVLIHDAARPFISEKTLSAVINSARKTGAAIVGVPVKATVKQVQIKTVHGRQSMAHSNIRVIKTIDRSNLWEIQTPQVFNKKTFLNAYLRFGDIDVTDDAMLVEKSGIRVSVVRGTYDNIKITSPEDLIFAQILSRREAK